MSREAGLLSHGGARGACETQQPTWVPLGQLEWTGTATWPGNGVVSWASALQECEFVVMPPGKPPNSATLRVGDLEIMLQRRDEARRAARTTCSDQACSSPCALCEHPSGKQELLALCGVVHPAAAVGRGPQRTMAQTPPGTTSSSQCLHISLSCWNDLSLTKRSGGHFCLMPDSPTSRLGLSSSSSPGPALSPSGLALRCDACTPVSACFPRIQLVAVGDRLPEASNDEPRQQRARKSRSQRPHGSVLTSLLGGWPVTSSSVNQRVSDFQSINR